MAKLIVNQNPAILNQSNVGHNFAKMAAMPPGWSLIDDYSESIGRDFARITATFRGPWSNRDQFIIWALGNSTTVLLPGNPQFNPIGQLIIGGQAVQVGQLGVSQPVPALSRNPPAQHWRWPWLYATDAEVRGQGAIGLDPQGVLFDNFGQPQFNGNGQPILAPMSIGYFDSSGGAGDTQSCVVKLSYGYLDWEVRTDQDLAGIQANKGELERWVIRESDPSAGFLPLPQGAISWVRNPAGPPEVQSGATIPETAANIIIFREELTYTHVDLPDPPYAAAKACTGAVNSVAFDGARGWPVYDPGTLLYQGMKRKRHRSPAGRICWDVIHRWLYAPTGWQNLPASDGNFYPVTYGGVPGGAGPFRSADMNTLFQPVAPMTYQ
jgi:hypothetical protein